MELLPVTLEGMLKKDVDSPEELHRMTVMVITEWMEQQAMWPNAEWKSYGPIYGWALQVQTCCDMLKNKSAITNPMDVMKETEFLCNMMAEIDVEEMKSDGFADIADSVDKITETIAKM